MHISEEGITKGLAYHEGVLQKILDDIPDKTSEASEEASSGKDPDKTQVHSLTCQVADLHN